MRRPDVRELIPVLLFVALAVPGCFAAWVALDSPVPSFTRLRDWVVWTVILGAPQSSSLPTTAPPPPSLALDYSQGMPDLRGKSLQEVGAALQRDGYRVRVRLPVYRLVDRPARPGVWSRDTTTEAFQVRVPGRERIRAFKLRHGKWAHDVVAQDPRPGENLARRAVITLTVGRHEGGDGRTPWIPEHKSAVMSDGAEPCFHCHDPRLCEYCHRTGRVDPRLM